METNRQNSQSEHSPHKSNKKPYSIGKKKHNSITYLDKSIYDSMNTIDQTE